jgi:hypothetical protein
VNTLSIIEKVTKDGMTITIVNDRISNVKLEVDGIKYEWYSGGNPGPAKGLFEIKDDSGGTAHWSPSFLDDEY